MAKQAARRGSDERWRRHGGERSRSRRSSIHSNHFSTTIYPIPPARQPDPREYRAGTLRYATPCGTRHAAPTLSVLLASAEAGIGPDGGLRSLMLAMLATRWSISARHLGGRNRLGGYRTNVVSAVCRLQLPVRQHAHDLARLHRGAGHEIRDAADAEMRQHAAEPHLGVVHGVAAVDRQLHRFVIALEAPARIRRVLAQEQAAARRQVLRVFDRAGASEVLRRGAEHGLDGTQGARGQAFRRRARESDHQVDVVLDRIDVAVGDEQLHVHFGMHRKEVEDQRVQHAASEGLRRGQAQAALRRQRMKLGDLHRRLRRTHHVRAAREGLDADLRQAQLTRGAPDQLALQIALEPAHLAAHGGRTDAEVPWLPQRSCRARPP